MASNILSNLLFYPTTTPITKQQQQQTTTTPIFIEISLTIIYFILVFSLTSFSFVMITRIVKYIIAPSLAVVTAGNSFITATTTTPTIITTANNHEILRLAIATLFPSEETLSHGITVEDDDDRILHPQQQQQQQHLVNNNNNNSPTTIRGNVIGIHGVEKSRSGSLRRQTSTFQMTSPSPINKQRKNKNYYHRQTNTFRVAEYVLAASFSSSFILPKLPYHDAIYYLLVGAVFIAGSIRFVVPIAKLTRTLALRASRRDPTYFSSPSLTTLNNNGSATAAEDQQQQRSNSVNINPLNTSAITATEGEDEEEFDPSMKTAALALGGVFQSIVWLCWIYFIASVFLDIDMTGLKTGFGIGGVLVAFSLQKTVESVFGTFAILVVRPFVVGDRITLQSGEAGTVETIGLRATEIRLVSDGEILIVPNNELASTRVKNRSRCDNRRVEFRFEIDPTSLPANKLALTRLMFERAIRLAPNLARIDKVVLIGIGPWGGYLFEAIFFVIGNETTIVRDTKSIVIENIMMVCMENKMILASGPKIIQNVGNNSNSNSTTNSSQPVLTSQASFNGGGG
jgi:small-conductance mechanosensitive channel